MKPILMTMTVITALLMPICSVARSSQAAGESVAAPTGAPKVKAVRAATAVAVTRPAAPAQRSGQSAGPSSPASIVSAATVTRVLSVAPNKLSYAPGETLTFTGTLKTSTGTPVASTQIGVDNPITLMCTLGPTTDSKGSFTYKVPVPTAAKGNYGFVFYGGASPVFAVVTVRPLAGLQLSDKRFSIPLGVAGSCTLFNIPFTRKVPTASGMPKASLGQIQDALRWQVSFMGDVAYQSLIEYVSNPVNDVVALGSVGCTVVGVWSGAGVVACTPLYEYDIKALTKASYYGIMDAAIDKCNLSSADKQAWKSQERTSKCVVGLALWSSSDILSGISAGWTCGSASATVVTKPSGKKVLEVVALPATGTANQTAVGFALLQK